MAYPFGHGGIGLAKLIQIAEAQGCKLVQTGETMTTPWGDCQIKYLLSPDKASRFDITVYEDDEAVLRPEIERMERRLKIKLSYDA